jgi:hypothetical protein
VVCPPHFRQALRPWVEWRTAQGHTISLTSNQQPPDRIRAAVRAAARGGKLRFVVLVGDAEPAMADDARVRARSVPAHYAPAKARGRPGADTHIATDNWYADLDDDHVPDVAVGRITADSPEELARIVAKILAYERSADFSLWRRQVNFVAGVGGFGWLADAAIDTATRRLITDGLPTAYSTTMTYANWRSPYCPDPRNFRQATLDRLNEGCLLWVYIGHGQPQSVDYLHVPGGRYPILSRADCGALACQAGSPIACFLACYAGAFDHPQDCLAEEMLRAPGGPVAVLSGSRVTMPYAMAVLGSELLDECFVRRQQTLGEAFLAAKRSLMDARGKTRHRPTLDALAMVLAGSAASLAAERADHLELFNLIGDPLLSLHYPQSLNLRVVGTARAGGELVVEGESPIDGGGVVELVSRRDGLTFSPPPRDRYDGAPAALRAFDAVYRRANDPRWSAAPVSVTSGHFSAWLRIPAAAHGACHIRVFIEGPTDCAAAATDVAITRLDAEESQ